MIQIPMEMKRASRMLCLVMVLALLLPAPFAQASSVSQFGVVTIDNVLFRKAADSSDYWARLNRGWVAEILGSQTYNGNLYYKAKTNLPNNTSTSFTGYLRSDVFRPMTSAELTAFMANPVQAGYSFGSLTPTSTPSSSNLSNLALVTVAGAVLRATPSTTGTSVTTFPLNHQLTLVPAATANGWYLVMSGEFIGYVDQTQVRVLTLAEAAALQTPAPVTGAIGYAKITLPGTTNLRRLPDGAVIAWLDQNQVVPYFSQPQRLGAYDWLYVMQPSTGIYGYIRSDCYQIQSGGTPTPAPGQTPTPAPSELTGYIKINKPSTNLRRTPGGISLLQLPINTILPYFGNIVSSLGYNWAYVNHPSGGYGYVRGDCYDFSTQAGVIVTPTLVPVQPTAVPSVTTTPGASTGYITLIKGGVNLRQTAGGPSIGQLERDTVLPYYGFTQQGGYTWYYVLSTLGAGYIRSDMAKPTDSTGQNPVVTPVPTSMVAVGYILTLRGGINLRRTPNLYAEVLMQVTSGRVLPLAAPVVTNAGYNWYFVQVDGRTGYLRGDMLRQLTVEEVTLYLSSGVIPGAVAPTPGPSQITGHIVTTMSSVNVRISPSLDAQVLTQASLTGSVFPMYSTVSSGGKLWYKVQSSDQVGYILGSLARVMSLAEYQAWLATQTPTATPQPGVTPNPADMSSTAVTNIDRVIVRAAATMSSKSLTVLYKTGSIAKLLDASAPSDGYNWYHVTAGGITGYIRTDLLRVLTKAEEALLNQTGDPSAPPEAEYRTLYRGMTGDDVTRLQTELVRLNFLPSAAISGVFTTQTAEAVKAYQSSAGLFIDGIAGPNTQHKLYGTVPVGTYNPTPGPSTLYPVEMYTWLPYSTNQTFWPDGRNAVITDVKTGISWTARRWAGGLHADVEPLTADDTAAMCRIYGVSNAQEILEKNLYERRPVWVTVLGHTYAGSVYGVPHNYPDGDTIADNDFNGQFCVHFINSKTHTSGGIDAAHQAAIQYAYDHAPSRMP